jgi:hypothetical protein
MVGRRPTGVLPSVASVIGNLKRRRPAVCTENLIRVDDVMESPKLPE